MIIMIQVIAVVNTFNVSQLYYFSIATKNTSFPTGLRGKLCREGMGFENKSLLEYSDFEYVSLCSV